MAFGTLIDLMQSRYNSQDMTACLKQFTNWQAFLTTSCAFTVLRHPSDVHRPTYVIFMDADVLEQNRHPSRWLECCYSFTYSAQHKHPVTDLQWSQINFKRLLYNTHNHLPIFLSLCPKLPSYRYMKLPSSVIFDNFHIPSSRDKSFRAYCTHTNLLLVFVQSVLWP